MDYLINKLVSVFSDYSYINEFNEYILLIIIGTVFFILALAFYIVFDVSQSYKEEKILRLMKINHSSNERVKNKYWKKWSYKQYKECDEKNNNEKNNYEKNNYEKTEVLNEINSSDTDLIVNKFQVIKIHKMYESKNSIFEELNIDIDKMIKNNEKGRED